jgi:hypothetical protein
MNTLFFLGRFEKILGEFFQNVRRKNIFVHEKNNFLGRNKNPVGRDASSRGSQEKFLTTRLAIVWYFL